jgi:hypothetical protein
MSVTAPFPYTINPDVARRNPTAVFKLVFGKKYFIFKGLKIAKTVEGLSAQIHREKNNPKDDSILINVISYIKRQRIVMMDVEVLFESDAIVDILHEEYKALQAAKKDENCLNTRFTNNEYFPQWVPQSAINEFQAKLQGVHPTDHEKKLRTYLRRTLQDEETAEKIVNYVLNNFRASRPRPKKHESSKNIPKK